MTTEQAKQLTLVEPVPQPVTETGSAALMRLIERAATSPDFDVDKLQKLLDVKTQWEATEARKAYIAAVSAFKSEPLTIEKKKAVSFGTNKTSYHHATLDHVCAVVVPALASHGLSHRWETEQLDGGLIRVSCVLTHILGHSERVTMQSGADASGSKNPIQAIASATTYLARYTLLMITGLATSDMDDDARKNADFVTTEQADELQELVESVGADKPRFFQFCGADTYATIPAAKFAPAKAFLMKKAGK